MGPLIVHFTYRLRCRTYSSVGGYSERGVSFARQQTASRTWVKSAPNNHRVHPFSLWVKWVLSAPPFSLGTKLCACQVINVCGIGTPFPFPIGLNIFYSSQDTIKDVAERKAMFSPLHDSLFRSVSQMNPTLTLKVLSF